MIHLFLDWYRQFSTNYPEISFTFNISGSRKPEFISSVHSLLDDLETATLDLQLQSTTLFLAIIGLTI